MPRGELVEEDQAEAALHSPGGGVRGHKLPAEGGKALPAVLPLPPDQAQAVEEGYGRRFGEGEQAAMDEVYVQSQGLEAHAFAPHVGPREYGGPGSKGERQRREGGPLGLEAVPDGGMDHVHEGQLPIGEGGLDAAQLLDQGGFGKKQVQMSEGVQAVSYRFSVGHQLLGQGRAQTLLRLRLPGYDGCALQEQGFTLVAGGLGDLFFNDPLLLPDGV